MLLLSLDTTSDYAGVALSLDGELLAEVTWRTERNHSRELLPTVEWLLTSRGFARTGLGAVAVCLGPGSYAGMRVGIATAKALAYGFGIPIVGVGRLAADAEPMTLDGGPAVHAVHVAGRAELAWATYSRRFGELVELTAPRLGREPALLEAVATGNIVRGELPEALAQALVARGALLASASSRVVSVARIGWDRLARDDIDADEDVVPMYLREPAIGPQPAPAT